MTAATTETTAGGGEPNDFSSVRFVCRMDRANGSFLLNVENGKNKPISLSMSLSTRIDAKTFVPKHNTRFMVFS